MLPSAHSPLGASSAERWMNCPGSAALAAALPSSDGFADEDPDYRRDGIEAHALAAHCLEQAVDAWEAFGEQFPSLTVEMMQAVQVYLDHVRSLPGRFRQVEVRLHRPEFHPQAYGTADCVAVSAVEEALDLVDYKHGAGVFVSVVDNLQLKYYAFLFIGDDREEYPDTMRVRLHIVQPRIEHADTIRVWETTAGAIRQWAHEELLPAMLRVASERFLSIGDWCRFCPAKLICPAMTALQDKFTYHRNQPLDKMPAELVGELYDNWTLAVKGFGAKLEAEVKRRGMLGEVLPYTKYVASYSERAWKEDAPLEATFGDDAWTPRKLVGPAAIEKLAGGKEFAAEWAFKPDAGITVAHVSSRFKEVPFKTDAEKYGVVLADLSEAGE